MIDWINPDDVEDTPRPVVAIANDYPPHHELKWHRHRRGQLLYAARGVVVVSTPNGAWVAPPERAVWTPPGVDLSAPVDAEVADMVRRLSTLTPQQVRVLMMLSEGLLNKQIAYELGVSEATVKAHVSAILTKLDVDSRTQAVIAASKIAGTAWATAGAAATA